LKAIESALKHCLETKEPSVIIVRGPCPLNVKIKGKPSKVDEDLCTSCYMCLDIGCPAISLANDKAVIDAGVCLGTACGVCAQVCPQEAILKAE